MVFADVLLDVGVVSLALMPAVYGVALGGSSQYRTALNVNYSILIRIIHWALRTSPLSGQATTDFMPSFSSPCLPLKGSVRRMVSGTGAWREVAVRSELNLGPLA